MTHCILVMGPDRVGKTTMIERTINSFPEWVYGKSWHFTVPKNKNSPMLQYENFLKLPFEDKGVDFVFMDRGFPETVFYESWRLGNLIPDSELIRITKLFQARFINFTPTLIHRSWDDIRAGHIDEIANGVNHNESAESPNLLDREAEYYAYYKFMKKYVKMFPMLVNEIYNPTIDQILVSKETHI